MKALIIAMVQPSDLDDDEYGVGLPYVWLHRDGNMLSTPVACRQRKSRKLNLKKLMQTFKGRGPRHGRGGCAWGLALGLTAAWW